MTTNVTPTRTIEGFEAGRMTASERNATLIRRPWRRGERSVVLHGYFGQLYLCGAMFLVLTIGLLSVRADPTRTADDNLAVLVPIFAFAFTACTAYAIALMFGPTRALLHTFRPIFIVDGYVRYRCPDVHSPAKSNGYLAVLTEDGCVACEWPTRGDLPLQDLIIPALSEFSEYGGLRTIDGHPTGALPNRIPNLTVDPKHNEIIP
jgi:hypothetical protein